MATEPLCDVCGTPTHHSLAVLCRRCKKIIDRIETRKDSKGRGRRVDKRARLRAMRASWRDGAFHCFYTGVALVESDWRDPRYVSWEHRTPGDESSVVVTSSLVNRMKTDLSEDEFRRLVTALARSFETGESDPEAFPDRKQSEAHPAAGARRRLRSAHPRTRRQLRAGPLT